MLNLLKIITILGMAVSSSAMCPMGYTESDSAGQRQLRRDCPELKASTPQGYQSWNREDKVGYLREKINENTQSVDPISMAAGGLKVMLEDMSVTEDWESDEMPEPQHFWESARVKPIHHIGFMAEVKALWKDSKYTGMFKEGELTGFIRAACAFDPDYTQADAKDGKFAPGIALKFLRDGKPSGNLFAINSLDGVDSWSFFKATVTNHIPFQHLSTAFKVVMKKFSTAPSTWPSFTGLSAFASTEVDGSEVAKDEVDFPFQIMFKGNPELAAQFPDTGPLSGDFYETMLSKVEPGTLMYTIHAKDTPSSPPVLIGELYSTSKFTPSYYGDTKLFFQHVRYDDDLKLRPEFEEECKLESCLTCPTETPCGDE